MAFDPTAFLYCLIGLQFKHFLADFCLQTTYMVQNKGKYGHPGGLLHAGVHATLTLVVLFLWAPVGTALIVLAMADFIAHYHIDWTKLRLGDVLGFEKDSYLFWLALGLDQYLHQLTMVAIIWFAFF